MTELDVQINGKRWRLEGWKASLVGATLSIVGILLGLWIVAAFVLGSRDILQWILG